AVSRMSLLATSLLFFPRALPNNTYPSARQIVCTSKTRRKRPQPPGPPPPPSRHDRGVTRRIELLFDCLNGCRENFLLHLLPCAVLLVQLYRQSRRFLFIVREQQSQGFLRRAQSARSVQPGSQAISNIFGQNRRTHSRNLH